MTSHPLTLDDATQFTRPVLHDRRPATLLVTKTKGTWDCVSIDRRSGRAVWLYKSLRLSWEPNAMTPFPTAQAALDAAMATPQITEVES